VTEREIQDALARKFGKRYPNGASMTLRYAYARHVRWSPLWPQCIADFLVLDTWGNYGPEHDRHPLIGFEIKVSRGDYLREIRDLRKSEMFRSVCREWYIVVPDMRIVRDDLPDGWGLMAVGKTGRVTTVRKSAPNIAKPMPRPLIAGFMRAAVTQAQEPARG
jgi:hypothetical protein